MRLAIRSPRYGVEYGSLLLIILISLAFALISPIIVLFGSAFCAGMWVFWRCVSRGACVAWSWSWSWLWLLRPPSAVSWERVWRS
jgi:hypothetical protein